MQDKMLMPVWTIGLFIVVMNTTMFNVSIPSIIQDLNITADLGAWVISSYSIGYALSTVIYSRLSDAVTIRKLLTAGLCVLGFSSIIGLFAHSFSMLLAARILQSAGAGAMAGLGLVIASRYVPPQRRGSAIAMISAGSAMAFGLGPIVGGIINEFWGWNGLFAVTCLVLIILPLLLRLLPQEKAPAFHFDLAGAALTVINAATLLLAVTQLSWIWLLVSMISFILHAWQLRKGSDSFINPELLRNKVYLKLVVIGFCLLTLNLGNLFLMPLVLAKIFSLSALRIGFTIAPGAILSAFLTRYVGRWIDRYGNLRFLLLGHLLLVLVLLSLSLVVGHSPTIILLAYMVFSPAFSATIAALNNEASQILPRHLIGSGMGLMQLIQFFGGSISVAVCGLLLKLQPHTELVRSYEHVYTALLVISVISMGMLFWYRQNAFSQNSI